MKNTKYKEGLKSNNYTKSLIKKKEKNVSKPYLTRTEPIQK
jgi:hypothetical protein